MNEMPHRICSFLDPNTCYTNDFMEYFRNSVYLFELRLKLSIFRPYFLSVGLIGRLFLIPQNSTRIYHFDTQFEGPILVTVNFK